MVACLNPFASTALLGLSPLVDPTGVTVQFSDPQAFVLTFPQAMNVLSMPGDLDWTITIDGSPVSIDSKTWLSATELEIETDSPPSPYPCVVSYSPGVNPLEIADQSRAYGSFGPLTCPFG